MPITKRLLCFCHHIFDPLYPFCLPLTGNHQSDVCMRLFSRILHFNGKWRISSFTSTILVFTFLASTKLCTVYLSPFQLPSFLVISPLFHSILGSINFSFNFCEIIKIKYWNRLKLNSYAYNSLVQGCNFTVDNCRHT